MRKTSGATANRRPDDNVNTEWIHQKGVWIFYLVIIAALRLVQYPFHVISPVAWTFVNCFHATLNFFFFHWIKGTPFEDWAKTQGKYDRLTFWEQIEKGQQFTATKKYLTLVPVVLFCITLYKTSDDLVLLSLNVLASGIIIAGKLPFMHKQRIFGINS